MWSWEADSAETGFGMKTERPLEFSAEQIAKGSVDFDINGGSDSFGKAQGGERLQIWLGPGPANASYKIQIDAPDADPDSFESRSVPLSRLLDAKAAPCRVDALVFQFVGSSVAGVRIKAPRIELK
jgi:hypothetical protein